MQGAVKEDAGVIARERPPGAVRTVQPRREADDQQPVPRAPEWLDRPAMVIRMRQPDGFEVPREARAKPALRVERGARKRAGTPQRALNCASSVDPRMAVIEELPPVTVCVTSSK